ncbi:MAG TPA: hypothetical protein PLK94_09595 [Alphaproteobacteria bacterium]|nr:hypothetical protein [Alphaproteobacteria bacterium]HOO51524.1 hypothetical protein [Alphaproteobacteria bacterium]
MQVAPVRRYSLESSDVRRLATRQFNPSAVSSQTTRAVPSTGPIYTADGTVDNKTPPHSLFHLTA